MKRSRFQVGAYATLAVGVVAIFAWYRHGSEWAAVDKFAPPPFPTAGNDARPRLASLCVPRLTNR